MTTALPYSKGPNPFSIGPTLSFLSKGGNRENSARPAALLGYPAQSQPFLVPSFARLKGRWHMEDVHGLPGSQQCNN
jgi:hypothetical protein